MTRVISIILLLIITSTAAALPDDRTQQMHISADSSHFDLKEGVYIYKGNVISTQGSSYLKGDLVTSKTDSNKQLISIIVQSEPGQLAHYHTTPKEGDKPLDAKASTIYYYPNTNKIIFEGHAVVTQGSNTFTGPKFIYNLATQTIITEPLTEPDSGRSHFSLDLDSL